MTSLQKELMDQEWPLYLTRSRCIRIVGMFKFSANADFSAINLEFFVLRLPRVGLQSSGLVAPVLHFVDGFALGDGSTGSVVFDERGCHWVLIL